MAPGTNSHFGNVFVRGSAAAADADGEDRNRMERTRKVRRTCRKKVHESAMAMVTDVTGSFPGFSLYALPSPTDSSIGSQKLPCKTRSLRLFLLQYCFV